MIIFLVIVSNLSVKYTATSFLLLFSLNIKLKESLKYYCSFKERNNSISFFFLFFSIFLDFVLALNQ